MGSATNLQLDSIRGWQGGLHRQETRITQVTLLDAAPLSRRGVGKRCAVACTSICKERVGQCVLLDVRVRVVACTSKHGLWCADDPLALFWDGGKAFGMVLGWARQ